MAEQQKRLNTFISAETFKRVKLWAAEHETTLGAAVDGLLMRGFAAEIAWAKGSAVTQEAGLSPEKKRAQEALKRFCRRDRRIRREYITSHRAV